MMNEKALPDSPGLVEKTFTVIALFFSTTALIPIIVEVPNSPGVSPDPISPVLFALIYVVTFCLVIKHWRDFLYVAKKDIFVWIIVAIAIASITWTIAPDVTPRRSFLFMGTTTLGVYLATRYSIKEQLNLLAWVFSIVIILSFIVALALPSYGLMTTQEGGIHAGAWRGIMSHKNIFGRQINVSAIVFLMLCVSQENRSGKYRWVPWAGYILSIALILLSASKTALVVWLTLSTIFPLYRGLRGTIKRVVPLLIGVVLVGGTAGILLIDSLPLIAGALGKDLTLTGRTDIWALMAELIAKRPLFGYGFNAFWQGYDTETSAYIWRVLDWSCPYGHNGLMDLLGELGFSALSLFLLSYITIWARAITWLRATNHPIGLWPVMYLTYLFLCNITESTLIASNSIFWVLYVSICVSVPLEYQQLKRMRYTTTWIDEESPWTEDFSRS
jgi:exopolysaccharide production protein ExoQ